MRVHIAALLLALVLAACGETRKTDENIPVGSPKTEVLAELSLKVDVLPNGVVLSGSTNLPDDTELLVGVDSEAYVNSNPNEPNTTDYRAQAHAVVVNGGFIAERINDDGHALNPGRYLASVIMPIPEVQPKAVQAVVGRSGQQLTGPLVKHSGMGTTVQAEIWFTVP